MKPSIKMSVQQKTFNSMRVLEQTMSNSFIFVAIILFSAVSFFVMLVFNAIAGNPNLIKDGPFKHSIGNVSAMFPLKITPADWTFSIWGLIFLIQIGSTLYSLGNLCRTTEKGLPAYKSPAILSPVYFVLFSLNSCVNIGWLFLWDRFLFSASLVFLAVQTLSLFSALAVASTRLVFYQSDLIDTGRKTDVGVIRVCVINGLGIYATWCTIATLLNFGVAALYHWKLYDLTDEQVSDICLATLFVLLVVYSVLDLTVMERYTRFTLTPYLTVIWALSGVIAKNWDASAWSSIISAVVLGVACVLFIVKIATSVYRSFQVINPYRRVNPGKLINLQNK